ncbi:MAG TPA: thiamine phosphate synthase [Terriglobales bacterium]|nr:thiamine phosphate synthase [Terriglobales bacterium]
MPNRCLLYYITDRSQFRGDERARRRALLDKIIEAVRAGVDYIQLREKDLSTRALEILARETLTAMRNGVPLRTENREPRTGFRTRLLINSRTDVALAAGVDGVHLRADDLSPREVRAVVGLSAHQPPAPDRFFVAVSCHTAANVFRAESEAADFAVFAPVFEKKAAPALEKKNTPPTGLADLREACRANIPVLALGGVNLENAASCLNAGAAGIAAIRLFQENRIEDIVRKLRAL